MQTTLLIHALEVAVNVGWCYIDDGADVYLASINIRAACDHIY